MILATKIQSEKGKEIIKTANEFIEIIITGDRIPLWKIRVDKTDWYNLYIHNLVNKKKSYKYDDIYPHELKQ